MSEGNPDYLKLLEEMKTLHLKKAADYGSDDDPLTNLRGSTQIGIEPWKGCWLRALDKVKRINQFCLKGHLENESVEDSFKDLAAYCLLALTLMREKKKIPSVVSEARKAGYDAFRCPHCTALKTVSSGNIWKCDHCRSEGVIRDNIYTLTKLPEPRISDSVSGTSNDPGRA